MERRIYGVIGGMCFWAAAVIAVFALNGCSANIRLTDITFEQNADNGSDVAMKTDASGATNTTGTDQVADGRINLAAAMEGAQAALQGIKDSLAEYKPDLSKKDSENQTDNSQTTTIYNEAKLAPGEDLTDTVDPGKVEPVPPTEPNPGEYKNKATYTSYGQRNGGREAWRIPHKGPEFGKLIKVVFSDGHTVFVKDTSHNYRESDGFVFKPGIGPNGEGSADTGTAHGGVYLHAPYGNKSKQVTFYFDGDLK